MYISQETNDTIETSEIDILEQIIYDIRDAINTRYDQEEVIEMMSNNGMTLSADFCKRKRPTK